MVVDEFRMEDDVGREREHIVHLIRQRRAAQGGDLRAFVRGDRDGRRHRIERLRDLLGRLGGRAFVHQGRRRVGKAGKIFWIVVPAGAGDDDLERHRRDAVIFEHHQMRAVRQIRFGRPRQRNLQRLRVDRRHVLELRRLAGLRRRLLSKQ